MTTLEDGSPDVTVERLIDQLRLLGNDAVATLEVLEGYRQELESRRAEFDQPQTVAEYIAYFVEMGGRVAAECERIASQTSKGVAPVHIASLRQIASLSAADESRCVAFREACINRPLPHEGVRPLLNDISITTRDQLTALCGVNALADRLEALIGTNAEADGERSFPRRALFSRLFKPPRRASGSGTGPIRRRT